jgi:hypothetical protein
MAGRTYPSLYSTTDSETIRVHFQKKKNESGSWHRKRLRPRFAAEGACIHQEGTSTAVHHPRWGGGGPSCWGYVTWLGLAARRANATGRGAGRAPGCGAPPAGGGLANAPHWHWHPFPCPFAEGQVSTAGSHPLHCLVLAASLCL